ncbi:UNVERIFIED_CONTAM: hypothetical protein Slati_1725100 [Sesamum latifolium]|uniref:Reverse transcriptase domain-containing protein n=1 Tax=Sesamum latifolium TaxID=2727402 RepID=A0AAW2WW40_9LAMI
MDFKDKKPAWQRVNMVYTPLTVPITQALMAVEGKGLVSRPRLYKDGPRQPKSGKFCRFHNDYGHTTEECRHLKSEIERLIQNRYLQETSMMGKVEVNDPPRKGIIRMIIGGPASGDSQRARRPGTRSLQNHDERNLMDVEPTNDAPLIRFDQEEHNEPGVPGNDALVITALLANYEIERVFIDSDSSADILFGEAYDQMQLGDIPLEAVDSSLYDLVPGSEGVGEAQADVLQARKCYVEAIKRGKKRVLEEASGKGNPNKRGKDPMLRPELKEEDPIAVQSVEEILTIELIPGDPDKITKIRSKMKEDDQEQVVNYLRKNKYIFAWTPQDLEGIDRGVITHHLNLDSTIKPIKQKKRHFKPEKDKII